MGDVLIGGLTGETVRSPITLLTELVKTTSPTTSTPGSTPSSKGSKEDLFGESGGNEGEMSAICTNEDDDIEIIKDNEEVDPTLDGNSVDESYCQAASDPAWKSLKEKEDEKKEEEDPQSCVAQRTRSHTGEIRKRDLIVLW